MTFKPIVCLSMITAAHNLDQAIIQSNIKLNVYLEFTISNYKRRMHITHLYLANNVGQSLAAAVLSLHRLACNTISDDDKDLGQVGIVRTKNNGVVAAVTMERGLINNDGIKSALGVRGQCRKLTFQ